MKITDIIAEVWKKGNITKNQMVHLMTNLVKNRGEVKLLPKGEHVASLTMKYIDFIEVFSGYGDVSDRLLNMTSQQKKQEQMGQLSLYASGKADKIVKKLIAHANSNIREYIPDGWMIAGAQHGIPFAEDIFSSTVTFNIKRDHSEKVDHNKTYYHATTKQNAEKIVTEGLKPSRGTRNEFDSYKNRIFLTETLEQLSYEFLVHLFTSMLGSEASNADIVVFEITLSENYEMYRDDQYGTGAVYTEQHIPPEALKVIYNGKLNDIPWDKY